jgi:hypothetical protein
MGDSMFYLWDSQYLDVFDSGDRADILEQVEAMNAAELPHVGMLLDNGVPLRANRWKCVSDAQLDRLQVEA